MTSKLISGVVLAGGQGRRMGGVDKGLQMLRGKPMVQWVVERFAPQVDSVLINANQNIERYAAFGYPVVCDRISGFAGPLAGLHAALSTEGHSLVATVPCDAPLLPADLVARLAVALEAHGASIAVARTLQQPHPVFCLCRRSVLPDLSAFLESGGRRFEQWCAALRAVEVAFDDQVEAFSNINTLDDLKGLGLAGERL
jgi:molybdopterin-guanine dinucleotide biosynthesis protein A